MQHLPASLPQHAAGFAALSHFGAVQEEHSFFVAQEARRRELETKARVRKRVIKIVGWERFTNNEVKTLRSSTYLLTCTGAGGGGGAGLEAQETRPPAMTEAARARRAYFIVCVCVCDSSMNYDKRS